MSGRLRFSTRLGACELAWEGDAVTGFSLPREEAGGQDDSESLPEDVLPPWVRQLADRVRRHMRGEFQDFGDVPLAWARVSAFQRGVYEQTRAIKAGCTKSYGDIARALGLGPAGARAVGVALSTNPWPLVVPCHRVVAANGRMTGFSAPGGVQTKTRLLALEGAELLFE